LATAGTQADPRDKADLGQRIEIVVYRFHKAPERLRLGGSLALPSFV
jgi:hypothetical protein